MLPPILALAAPLPRLQYKILSNVLWIPDRELYRLEAALSLALGEFAADWELAPPSVGVVSRAADLSDTDDPIVLSTTIDVAGDLAYHTLLDGRPYALVLAPEGTPLGEVQQRACHEGVEGAADPFCDRFVTLENGNLLMVEGADPVEGQVRQYELKDGGAPVQMCNWVKPRWFVRGALAVPGGAKAEALDANGVMETGLEVAAYGGAYAFVVTPEGKIVFEGQGGGPVAERMHPAFRVGRKVAFAAGLAAKIRAGVAVEARPPAG